MLKFCPLELSGTATMGGHKLVKPACPLRVLDSLEWPIQGRDNLSRLQLHLNLIIIRSKLHCVSHKTSDFCVLEFALIVITYIANSMQYMQ